MPIVNLDYDLADVSSSNEAVPAGNYLCKIDEAELTESKNNNPMIKIQWEIVEGEFAGRKLFDNLVLIQKCAWKVKQYADIAGIEEGTQLDTQDFIGVEGIVEVEHEDYNGEPRAKVKNVSPVA